MSARQQTVLVIDEEPTLRRLVERMLQSAGYEVYTAANMSDAVTIAARLDCGLNLVLADMQMRRAAGNDLILAVRQLCPSIDAMGYTASLPDDPAGRSYPVLLKPFSKAELVRAVKEILDRQL